MHRSYGADMRVPPAKLCGWCRKPKAKKSAKVSLETEVDGTMLCVSVNEDGEGFRDKDSVYLTFDQDCDRRIVFRKQRVPEGELLVVDSVAGGLTTSDGWCGTLLRGLGFTCSPLVLLCTTAQRWLVNRP